MKIFVAKDSTKSLGGGFTFYRNFTKAMPPDRLANSIREADVVFLPSSSMVDPNTVEEAHNLRKPVFLRIDNVPKNSRNRNTGTSRLASYFNMARGAFYQSQWAKDYVGGWLDPEGKKPSGVIYNGVDQSIFNKTGSKHSTTKHVYIYATYSSNPSKNWHEAWYSFQMEWRKNKNISLWLIGKFDKGEPEYKFDFFQGEDVRYWGVVENQEEYATILRSAKTFYAPYYNDAFSNAIVEAISCGLEIDLGLGGQSGGNLEIFKAFEENYDFSIQFMCYRYYQAMEKLA